MGYSERHHVSEHGCDPVFFQDRFPFIRIRNDHAQHAVFRCICKAERNDIHVISGKDREYFVQPALTVLQKH